MVLIGELKQRIENLRKWRSHWWIITYGSWGFNILQLIY